MSKNKATVSITLDEGLLEKSKQRAKAGCRSLSGYFTLLATEDLAQRDERAHARHTKLPPLHKPANE